MDEEGETGGFSDEDTNGFDIVEWTDIKLLLIPPPSVSPCNSSPDTVNDFKEVLLTLIVDSESDDLSVFTAMLVVNEEFANADEFTKDVDENGKFNDNEQLFLTEDGNIVDSLTSISSLAKISISAICFEVLPKV